MGWPQLSAKENENATLSSYHSWLMNHPSALDTFEDLISIAKGRKIVVFLDYDGTLSNIVPNPDQAFMSNEMRMALSEVAVCFPTAIISGRSIEKVHEFVQLEDVYYAGSHGLDIAPPFQHQNIHSQHQDRAFDKDVDEVVPYQPAGKFLPIINKIIEALKEKTQHIKGVMIENNKFCVSVHFRHVSDKDFPTLEEQVGSILQDFKKFRLSIGKKVFEIRPDIDWDKGHALEYLLETLGYDSSSDVLPVYIGDDRTDEDAFKAVRSRGQGYPIVVTSSPKDTAALYSLRSPTEVEKFLLCLVKWKKMPIVASDEVCQLNYSRNISFPS